MRGRKLLTSVLTLLLIGSLAIAVYWPYFAGTKDATLVEQSQQQANLEPDPSDWQSFLRAILKDDGSVDYQRAMEQRIYLDRYLAQVANATPAAFPNDTHRLALYINAYNAMVIKGVLNYYPITSVDEVGPLHRFFRERKYTIAGTVVSLHGFESKVIRKYDPRLHFALNCASKSCPPLHQEAFKADILDQQLEEVTRRFILDTSANYYDANTQTLFLSQIFEWYEEDFGGKDAMLAFLANRGLGPYPTARVRYLPYNWELNNFKR